MMDEEDQAEFNMLQWFAAQFLLKIREACKISQTALNQVSQGVVEFLDIFSNHIVVSLI